jgi:hypothetical protein
MTYDNPRTFLKTQSQINVQIAKRRDTRKSCVRRMEVGRKVKDPNNVETKNPKIKKEKKRHI